MKELLVIALYLLFPFFLLAQSNIKADSGYALKIEKVNKLNDNIAEDANCGTNEYQLFTDCLSDFVLKDGRFKFYRIIDITSDHIIISRPGQDDPKIEISPADIISLNTIVWCFVNGSVGWKPQLLEIKDYTFRIEKGEKNEMTFKVKLCWDEECKSLYTGYLSCFSAERCKYVFKKDGIYYAYGMDDDETVPVDLDAP